LADTTRTIYDVAKAAYNDTTEDYTASQLNTIKVFIDAVADLTFKKGSLNVNQVITERTYTSPYLTSSADGYYYLARGGSEEMPKTIIINGKKVSSTHFDGEVNAGSMVMHISSGELTGLFTDGIVYGIGEPDSTLWNNGNTVATAEMLSNITGALGATAFRIWLGGEVAAVSRTNVVSLNDAKTPELFDLINGLANNGVKEVYLIGIHLQLMDYKRIYADEIGWVSNNVYYPDNIDKTIRYNDYSCVPDPSTEAEMYSKWLKLQYDYYNALSSQLATWQAANSSWSGLKFYFEGINEPEGQLNIHKRGNYSSAYTYNYFTTDELAKILTDVAYQMTLAVNANLDGTGFVTTPALMYITGNSGQTIASGVKSDAFLYSMASAILDGVAPTAIYGGSVIPNSTDPEDYFTVLNWHPYVSWLQSEHNELYYAEIKTTSSWYGGSTAKAYVNNDYPLDWVGWNNGMYHLFVDMFTGYAPKVVFTELGVIDFGTHVESSSAYGKVGVNEALAATVFSSLLNAVDELDFNNNCTIIGFRLCDVESILAAEQTAMGYSNMHVYGEGNLGFIEEDGTIKDIMKEYYYVINGTKDTTALQTVVSGYYD
ncbi:MAG: hypothetical protein J5911_03280, partial [Clostridia bacterium]|nr:hypothetical protein [Clostridia bacterium]